MLKKFVFTLFVSTLFTQPLLASDWGWQHLGFRSEQGAEIRVNYRAECYTHSLGRAVSAPELWIEVEHPAIQEGAEARVVFITKTRTSGRVIHTEEIDLVHRGGNLATAPYPFGYQNNVLTTVEEIALVIDGTWQKDPETQTNNFRFSLLQATPDWEEKPCL